MDFSEILVTYEMSQMWRYSVGLCNAYEETDERNHSLYVIKVFVPYILLHYTLLPCREKIKAKSPQFVQKRARLLWEEDKCGQLM